ncbi:MAG: pullulanase-associated domain-containing protein, partial [Myxococcales bacterium]
MCAPFRVAAALLFAGIACGKNEAPVSSQFTLHYHRPLADYDGWAVQTSAGANEATAPARTPDGFGAVYTLTLKDKAPKLDLTLAKSGQTDAAGPLSLDVSGSVREAWVISAYPEAITRKLPALPAANQAALYYLRRDTSYSGWGLHVWGERVTETQWAAPLASAGVDPEFGSGFLIPLKTGGAAGNCPSGQVCFIVHSGDNKDPGPDMRFDPATLGNLVFAVTGSTDVTAVPRKPAAVVGAAAHLIARDTLVWNVNDPSANSFELRYSPTAEVTSSGNDVTGGSTIALTPKPAGLSDAQKALVPHLATYPVFSIAAADLASVEPALRGQIIAVARKADGSLAKATQVQTAFALDDLYAYDGPLGITFSGGAPALRLWAPSARAVKLFIYDASTKAQIASADPSRDAQGVWTASGPAAWTGQYYRYELDVYHPVTGRIEHVTVTDPYAVNVDTNGKFAQIVDLSDPALKPANWDVYGKPRLDAPEDIVLYESHVRDFSAFDATVPSDHRGKYLAFTDVGTDGIKHLDELNGAGLTHIHLLPAFDFATIDEDPANRVDVGDTFDRLCAKNASVPAALCTQFTGKTIAEALASFAGDSDQQQAIAGYVRGLDSFNWGYDPFHYGVPEGSYASTAEGTAKILEFRQMVMALNDRFGLSVVMDVVYNHTNASGLAEKSVLDKVVPWYYHRLDPETGAVLTSSCCANTATEHHMMEKLMIDTLVRWARDYKVDGFRFDLMGLHLKANMIHVRDALAA